MTQAIHTSRLGPTNIRDGRYKATASGGESLTLPSDYSSEGNHAAVAYALAERLNWGGLWVSGGLKDGRVFVCLPNFHPRTASGALYGFAEEIGQEGVDWFYVTPQDRSK